MGQWSTEELQGGQLLGVTFGLMLLRRALMYSKIIGMLCSFMAAIAFLICLVNFPIDKAPRKSKPNRVRFVKLLLTRLSIVFSNALTLLIARMNAFRINKFIKSIQLSMESMMETKLKYRTMLFVVTAVVAGAVQAADGKQVVQTANTQWLTAFNSGKAAALPSMYTTDAVLLADGSAPVTGRDGIQKYWEGALKMGLKEHTFTPITVKQEGKIAYQAATWTLMAPTEGGGSMQATGSAVHVLEKQPDGKWLIKVHIYNTK